MPLAVFIVHYHTTFRILGGWKMFLLKPHSSPYSTSVFCLKAFEGFYSVNKLHTQVWDKSFETWKQYGSHILPDETSTVQTTVTVMYTTCLKWLPYSPDHNFLLFWSVSLCCYQSHIISALTDVHFNKLKYFLPPERCNTTGGGQRGGTSSSSWTFDCSKGRCEPSDKGTSYAPYHMYLYCSKYPHHNLSHMLCALFLHTAVDSPNLITNTVINVHSLTPSLYEARNMSNLWRWVRVKQQILLESISKFLFKSETSHLKGLKVYGSHMLPMRPPWL